MSVDPSNSETNLGFELTKTFGILISVLITVVLLLFLNPWIGAALIGWMFSFSPLEKSIDKAMKKIDNDLTSVQTRAGSYTPDPGVTTPLRYGEGLTAFKDLEPNVIIEPKDIATRTTFPTAELARSSPLPYSSLIGKKTKTTIKHGEFFTTTNVEF